MKKYIIICFIILLSACRNTDQVKNNKYADNSYWISIPDNTTYSVDVFYLYPTLCVNGKNNICTAENENMKITAKQVQKLQADAFKNIANIYTPSYTQYDIEIFKNSSYNKMEQDIKNNTQALNDIYSALDYYFKYLNNGRPFILVSHSQGSAYMLIVLSDYMKKHKKYYKNMIAAYVLGYPVTNTYLKNNPHLKFAEKDNDTGVIISYDVQSPHKAGKDIMYTAGRQVINPINWSREEFLAKKEENKGSLSGRNLEIITPGIADAKINKKLGIIICSSVDNKTYEIKLPELFGTGSYHGYTFMFYYKDLEENAKNRINAFFNNHN